jgi:hypothetical protein
MSHFLCLDTGSTKPGRRMMHGEGLPWPNLTDAIQLAGKIDAYLLIQNTYPISYEYLTSLSFHSPLPSNHAGLLGCWAAGLRLGC